MVKKRKVLLFSKEVIFYLISMHRNESKRIKEYTKLPVLVAPKVDRSNDISKLQIRESKQERKFIKPALKDLKTTKIKLIYSKKNIYQLQVSKRHNYYLNHQETQFQKLLKYLKALYIQVRKGFLRTSQLTESMIEKQ